MYCALAEYWLWFVPYPRCIGSHANAIDGCPELLLPRLSSWVPTPSGRLPWSPWSPAISFHLPFDRSWACFDAVSCFAVCALQLRLQCPVQHLFSEIQHNEDAPLPFVMWCFQLIQLRGGRQRPQLYGGCKYYSSTMQSYFELLAYSLDYQHLSHFPEECTGLANSNHSVHSPCHKGSHYLRNCPNSRTCQCIIVNLLGKYLCDVYTFLVTYQPVQ